MKDRIDVQNPAWVKEAQRIHRLVAAEVKGHLEKEQDRLFDIEQACNRSLKLLKSLDGLLGADLASFKDYGEKHRALRALLKQLKIEALVYEKIAEKFGCRSFFITFFSQERMQD